MNLSAESAGLSRNRAVTGKRSSLEGFRTSRKAREEGKEAAEDKAKDSMREEAQVVMAARNLYQRCVSTQRGMKVEGVRFDEWETLDQKTRLKRLTDALELIGDHLRLDGHPKGAHGGGTGEGYIGRDGPRLYHRR